MKILQILLEILLVVFEAFNTIFLIQFNATVRVPGKLFAITICLLVIGVILLFLEFAELRKNREKTKALKEKYEDEIEEKNKMIEELKKENETLKENNQTVHLTDDLMDGLK